MKKPLSELLPNLKRVCVEIDADNGTHHAERLMPGVVAPFEMRFAYAAQPFAREHLLMWDGWVAMLNDDEIDMLAAGEHTDREHLLRCCPQIDAHTRNIDDAGLDSFFNRFFDPPDLPLRRPIFSEAAKHALTMAAPALLLFAIGAGMLIVAAMMLR